MPTFYIGTGDLNLDSFSFMVLFLSTKKSLHSFIKKNSVQTLEIQARKTIFVTSLGIILMGENRKQQ